MSPTLGRRLGLVWGALLLVFGVLEVVTHRNDTAAALAFWGLTLLGGGALVLAGILLRPSRRTLGQSLLILGTVAGILPTMWTLLMPLLGITVVVGTLMESSPRGGPETAAE